MQIASPRYSIAYSSHYVIHFTRKICFTRGMHTTFYDVKFSLCMMHLIVIEVFWWILNLEALAQRLYPLCRSRSFERKIIDFNWKPWVCTCSEWWCIWVVHMFFIGMARQEQNQHHNQFRGPETRPCAEFPDLTKEHNAQKLHYASTNNPSKLWT